MSVIAWEDPPPPGNWGGTVMQLKARPGAWALILERKDGEPAISSARQSLRKAGCATTSRSYDNGRYWSLWAMWPGAPTDTIPCQRYLTEHGRALLASRGQ